jgi:hypothetical protein
LDNEVLELKTMGNKSIYLDNCSYNRPFDDQRQLRISLETQAKLYIQSLVKNNRIDLIYSYVCFYENFLNPFEDRRLSINARANFFITVDDGILKYKTNEIKICDPIMFIKYWEVEGENDD